MRVDKFANSTRLAKFAKIKTPRNIWCIQYLFRLLSSTDFPVNKCRLQIRKQDFCMIHSCLWYRPDGCCCLSLLGPDKYCVSCSFLVNHRSKALYKTSFSVYVPNHNVCKAALRHCAHWLLKYYKVTRMYLVHALHKITVSFLLKRLLLCLPLPTEWYTNYNIQSTCVVFLHTECT